MTLWKKPVELEEEKWSVVREWQSQGKQECVLIKFSSMLIHLGLVWGTQTETSPRSWEKPGSCYHNKSINWFRSHSFVVTMLRHLRRIFCANATHTDWQACWGIIVGNSPMKHQLNPEEESKQAGNSPPAWPSSRKQSTKPCFLQKRC